MIAPFYNSRSTKFAIVTEGSGYIEILCPHVTHQGRRGSPAQRYREHEQERGGRQYREEEEEEYQEGPHYRRIRAHVSRGTVFIVPPGHPVVEVASRDQNLQTICFEIRADRNERIFLAGFVSITPFFCIILVYYLLKLVLLVYWLYSRISKLS